jgi:hypothetical protein
VTDPVADAARSAAVILAPDLGPNLPAEVEIALAARRASQRPDQYADLMSLASLIVAVATLAWTIYQDLREPTSQPPPVKMIAREIHFTFRDQHTIQPSSIERITDVIVTEITREP